VIHSLTANIGHCNILVHFSLSGANVFTLDSNKHYFRSRNRALPQDSHFLSGTTRDLWTVECLQLGEWLRILSGIRKMEQSPNLRIGC
jgi:hypothetical protein